MSEDRGTLVAVFDDAHGLTDAVKTLMDKGHRELEVLTPVPLPELEDVLPEKPSLVRWFTLAGCIAGAVLGMAFQIGTVLQWPHLVGGKPPLSFPAFVIVSFEMTILFGAIATLVGLLMNAKLPPLEKEAYYDSCSRTDFAIIVTCHPSDQASLGKLLSELGARDTHPVKPRAVLLGATEE